MVTKYINTNSLRNCSWPLIPYIIVQMGYLVHSSSRKMLWLGIRSVGMGEPQDAVSGLSGGPEDRSGATVCVGQSVTRLGAWMHRWPRNGCSASTVDLPLAATATICAV